MAEDRVEHYLVRRDQFLHAALCIVVEQRGSLGMAQDALRCLDISLLLRGQERSKAGLAPRDLRFHPELS